MKPAKIFKEVVDINRLKELSKKYLVKATDGKSIIVLYKGKILFEKGEAFKEDEKKEMVIALYKTIKRVKIKDVECLVNKIETKISTDIKKDLEYISKKYGKVLIEAFSRKAKKVMLLYSNGALVYVEGDYKKLIEDKKAILDVYEVVEEVKLSRSDLLRKYNLSEPSEEEVKKIIENALGDEVWKIL